MKKIIFSLIALFSFSLSCHPQSYTEIKKTKKAKTTSISLDPHLQSRRTLRGYRGFIDAGYAFDISGHKYSKSTIIRDEASDLPDSEYVNSNYFEISTSHGFQFNNFFFLGGGVGLDYYTGREAFCVPIFVNFRANFMNKKVTPFGDVKLGCAVGDLIGVHYSLALGARIATSKKTAVHLSLELAVQDSDELLLEDDDDWLFDAKPYLFTTLGLKVGFEF